MVNIETLDKIMKLPAWMRNLKDLWIPAERSFSLARILPSFYLQRPIL